MAQPRLVGELIDEIIRDLRELQRIYDKDCNDEILSGKAAAEYLGKSPVTISRYIASGKLEKVCQNGKTGIRKSELRRLAGRS